MKILITILLALFLSSHASAQSYNEIITKGKIIHKASDAKGSHTFSIMYKKKLYFCVVDTRNKLCVVPDPYIR